MHQFLSTCLTYYPQTKFSSHSKLWQCDLCLWKAFNQFWSSNNWLSWTVWGAYRRSMNLIMAHMQKNCWKVCQLCQIVKICLCVCTKGLASRPLARQTQAIILIHMLLEKDQQIWSSSKEICINLTVSSYISQELIRISKYCWNSLPINQSSAHHPLILSNSIYCHAATWKQSHVLSQTHRIT